jgi:hydrogenase large subunit
MHGSHPHVHDRTGKAIVIDPITRIEGHMKVEAVVDGGRVKEARCCGTLFRGFERILPGRHPLDAVRITQRVCGVCPTAHATASALALDAALGLDGAIPPNGRLVRNLILGSNFLQSHILHFFTLAALDYVDVTALADYDGDESELRAVREFIERGELAPFFPRYEGDYRCDRRQNTTLLRNYLRALHIRRTTHEMLCVFGGKMPHNVGIVPGGVVAEVTADKVATFAGKLADVKAFVEDAYIPSVLLVAERYGDHFDIGRGCGRFLSYGVFEAEGTLSGPLCRPRFLPGGLLETDGTLLPPAAESITEHVRHSRYDESCAAAPTEGSTWPDPEKEGAYSWIKAPRYNGAPAEVGPLARAMVAYADGHTTVKADVDAALSAANVSPDKLPSILGRHLARALEARWVCDAMAGWLEQLRPGEPAAAELTIPDRAEGAGMTGAPRGALGHWVQIRDGTIERYQLVVPTTWNASPADADGTPGPIEQALLGAAVRDDENPFEVVRTVRSFDPCLACAVHVLSPRGRKLGEYRIV